MQASKSKGRVCAPGSFQAKTVRMVIVIVICNVIVIIMLLPARVATTDGQDIPGLKSVNK